MPRKITNSRALIFRLDAQYRLLIALIFSAIVYFFCPKATSWPAQVLSIWIVFALTIIVLDWVSILWSHPLEVKKIAKLQDSSRYLLFLFVIFASLISLVAIVFLLKSSKGHSVATVMCCWRWLRLSFRGRWCIPYLPCVMPIYIMTQIKMMAHHEKAAACSFRMSKSPTTLILLIFPLLLA